MLAAASGEAAAGRVAGSGSTASDPLDPVAYGAATWPDEPDNPSTSASFPYLSMRARKSRA
jgi:hypothetical protein